MASSVSRPEFATRTLWHLAYYGLLAVTSWLPQDVAAQSTSDNPAIERIKPSIVAVGTYQSLRQPQFRFAGTGFAVGDGTLVATNAHVIPEIAASGDDPERLVVVLPERAGSPRIVREAMRAAFAADQDLAILRIGAPALPALMLGDSGRVRDGDHFLFTGFPVGTVLGLIPATHRAMVSAVTPVVLPSGNSRQLDGRVIRQLQSGTFEIFQLDAMAYLGSSGSPLYDTTSGEVVAVVNMTLARSTKESLLPQPTGIAYAIPAVHLRRLLESVK